MKYFKEEYIAHIRDHKCPAGVCTELITFAIIPQECTGCGACKTACPVNAIEGDLKQVHTLDQKTCIKCGACYRVCNFDAVLRD